VYLVHVMVLREFNGQTKEADITASLFYSYLMSKQTK